MAKKIHYPRHQQNTAVLAERNPDGSWDIVGNDGDPLIAEEEIFHHFYNPQPTAQQGWTRWCDTSETTDPNDLVDAGSHTLTHIGNIDELHTFWAEHPEAVIYEPRQKNVYHRGDLPSQWSWIVPYGRSLTAAEQHGMYWFPYFGAVTTQGH